jgi:hypothetical protein
VTKDGSADRNDAKFGPVPPCRFGERRREILEDGTQPYPNMEVIARSLAQRQRLDKLAQHTAQSRGGSRGPRQLFPLLVAMKDLRKDIVCACDDLQGLTQIVTGHRQ